jgi:hypothetical protein
MPWRGRTSEIPSNQLLLLNRLLWNWHSEIHIRNVWEGCIDTPTRSTRSLVDGPIGFYWHISATLGWSIVAGVKEIYATDRAFCAVCDGTIVTWGDPMYGGDSPCDLWRKIDPWDDNPVET